MAKTKLLIIGLTSNHKEHILALQSNSAIDIIGVCDIDSIQAEEISLKFGQIPHFDDYYKAIEILRPDALFISLPHDQYIEVVEIALRKNIHIFKEKPFAHDLAEAKKMAELFRHSHSKIMTVSQRRFHKTYAKGKELLVELGKTKYVFASYCFNKPTSGWRKSKKISGGGVIIDSGYHLIDLLLYYFGLPETVKCQLSKVSDDLSCETEDYASIELRYSDSNAVQLILNRLSEVKKEEIIIYGELGKLTVTKQEVTIELFDSGCIKKIETDHSSFVEAYHHQHRAFFDSVSNEHWPIPGIKEGMLNSLIIEACYLSAKANSSVINTKNLLNMRNISL
jgi:predicted dehydrogenase